MNVPNPLAMFVGAVAMSLGLWLVAGLEPRLENKAASTDSSASVSPLTQEQGVDRPPPRSTPNPFKMIGVRTAAVKMPVASAPWKEAPQPVAPREITGVLPDIPLGPITIQPAPVVQVPKITVVGTYEDSRGLVLMLTVDGEEAVAVKGDTIKRGLVLDSIRGSEAFFKYRGRVLRVPLGQ